MSGRRLTDTLTKTLKAVLGVGLIAGLIAGGATGWLYVNAATDTSDQHDFSNPLQIPQLAERTHADDGVIEFDLQVQNGTTQFRPGVDTHTWGVNGAYLGPTLRAEVGETVRINVNNTLDETTTLHWHGMHLPAVMDGGPHQEIRPGASWTAGWTINQPPATLWYHPHTHEKTADHVYRGVAGLFIIDDPNNTPLPDSYGVDDIPVIVQDKRLHSAGRLDFSHPPFSFIGILGDLIVVNGTTDPHFEITAELTRLRILNASNARIYNFGFSDGRTFTQIASDSGLLSSPVPTETIQLSPGERAEIVVAMSPGETVTLNSYPPELGTRTFTTRFNGGDDTLAIVQLRAKPQLQPSPPLSPELTQIERLDETDAATIRTFRLGGTDINDRRMDMTRIDEVIQVDTIEIWEITNRSGFPHNFHVHDIHFQILDIDGRPPPPTFAGWKDTVYIPPGAQVRIIGRFADYADRSNTYMFHCHILDHEDLGMMGQFVVTDQPLNPADLHLDHHAHQ